MIAEKFLNCPKCGEGGKRWLHDAQHCEVCGYSGIKAAFKPMVKPPATVAELEALLYSEDDRPVTINPDGSISERPDTDDLPTLKQMCALMNRHRQLADYERIKPQWDEAWHEAHCCDDTSI